MDLTVAGSGDNTVIIILGNGDGTFQPRKSLPVGGGPESVTTADFNHDGNLDIALANYLDNTISVLLGNGDDTM